MGFVFLILWEAMESLIGGAEYIEVLIREHPLIFLSILIWSLVWKALALWKSAQLSHQWWFIAILLLNTLGIVEILYLFFVGRNYSVKIEEK